MRKKEMRTFEYAVKTVNGKSEKAFKDAKLPEYKTRHSAGADLFCAEEIIIPAHKLGRVHTGIKAKMLNTDVLLLYNRSSNPSKRGLILANGVGVIDADYYGNANNDGEIMMEFYNITDEDVIIHIGDSIGQAVFSNFYYPDAGYVINQEARTGGYGSTEK